MLVVEVLPDSDSPSAVHVLDLPDSDDVFLMYEYELRAEHGGGVFRNTEVSTVRDGKLVETQVFFGGRVR